MEFNEKVARQLGMLLLRNLELEHELENLKVTSELTYKAMQESVNSITAANSAEKDKSKAQVSDKL